MLRPQQEDGCEDSLRNECRFVVIHHAGESRSVVTTELQRMGSFIKGEEVLFEELIFLF